MVSYILFQCSEAHCHQYKSTSQSEAALFSEVYQTLLEEYDHRNKGRESPVSNEQVGRNALFYCAV